MAIERMKSVWMFAPQGRAREVLDRLATLGLVHVADTGLAGVEDMGAVGIEQVHPDARNLERRVALLRETLDILRGFSKSSRDFLANFIPTPIEVRESRVREALETVNVEALHADVKERERRRAAADSAVQSAEAELKAAAVLDGLAVTIPGVERQQRTGAYLGTMSAGDFANLKADERMPQTAAVDEVARRGRSVVVEVACLAADREAVEALLRETHFGRLEPEEDTVTADEFLERRRARLDERRDELAGAANGLRALAAEKRRDVEMVLGFWEQRLSIAQTAGRLAESKRLTIIKGFVRAADLKLFQAHVKQELPEVALEVRDPLPDEAVPVSLRNWRFLAPAQFLVTMFGVPQYATFDPTPVIFFGFLVFFGCCFGDAIYGIALIIAGLLLARKYRDYVGLRYFFQLLAWAGVSTFIVGALTGTWAADIYKPEYLGVNNFLAPISDFFRIGDPLDKPLLALGVALGLGVINQLIAMVMLMVRNFRQGRPAAAICDGGFWLLVLPALVGFAGSLFVPIPAGVLNVLLIGAAIGAVGLVLTQGRNEKSIIGKAVVGVVSLYGIVGTYGATGFIGDTLSYCRLLALGLTTTVVGMCLNVIAGMFRGIPYAGLAIFLVIVVIGHTFNFFISLLGGFVHSARLEFVEFFGRFYHGGAPRFEPLGKWHGRIRVVDAGTVWAE